MDYKLVSERTGETIVIRREPIPAPEWTQEDCERWAAEELARMRGEDE